MSKQSKRVVESFENWHEIKDLLRLYMKAQYQIRTLRARYKTAGNLYEKLTDEQKEMVNAIPREYINAMWNHAEFDNAPTESELAEMERQVAVDTRFISVLLKQIIEAANSVRNPEVYTAFTKGLAIEDQQR